MRRFFFLTFHYVDEGFYGSLVYIARNNNDQVYLAARAPYIHSVATLRTCRIEPSNQDCLYMISTSQTKTSCSFRLTSFTTNTTSDGTTIRAVFIRGGLRSPSCWNPLLSSASSTRSTASSMHDYDRTSVNATQNDLSLESVPIDTLMLFSFLFLFGNNFC